MKHDTLAWERGRPCPHISKKRGLKARFPAAPEKQWNPRAFRPQNIFTVRARTPAFVRL